MIEKLIQEVESELIYLDKSQRDQVMTSIINVVKNYSVSKITTEVSTNVDQTMNLINQFSTIRLIEGIKESTVTNQKRFLTRFFGQIGVSYDKVKPIHITIHISQLSQHGVSQNSLNNVYNAINSFYKWLVLNDLHSTNPMDKVRRIKPVRVQKEAFTKCELEKIKEYCSTLDLAIISFWCSTGCRVSETINIKKDDVDFQNKTVCVSITKNGNPRTEYLSDVCIMRLKEYLDTRKDDCPYLFVTERGHHQFNRRSINKRLSKLSIKCGVENIHPHRFRRTFCTEGLNNGMPIQDMKVLMGHASIDTTMIYTHITDEKLKTSFNKYVN